MLSNLQIELLKLYRTDLSEQELKQLKIVLAKFFADKTIKEADKIWEEKKYDQNTVESWLNEKN